MQTWIEALAVLAASFCAAGIGILFLRRSGVDPLGPSAVQGLARHLDTPRLYRFRNAYLLERPDGEDPFLEAPDDRANAWDRLALSLGRLEPEVPAHLARLRDRGEAFALRGGIGPDQLTIGGRSDGGDVVISVALDTEAEGKRAVTTTVFDAMTEELDRLRHVSEAAPYPTWIENAEEQIVWANEAYLSLVDESLESSDLCWPLPRVFASSIVAMPVSGHMIRARTDTISDQEDAPWFDISAHRVRDETVFMARPVSRLVAAEAALGKFTQTLTKTFADLSVGLAIFDRDRKLVLFNPALVTLTQLSVPWLSTRPHLNDVLDQLRDRQRIPEPKDYREWRRRLVELEQAASEGDFCELWTLPDGQTLRVTGRPHVDGALAFHLEDITAEMSLTRQFRAEIDLLRQVLDQSDTAVVAFDADGRQVLSNGAFLRLWQGEVDVVRTDLTIEEADLLWRDQCQPTHAWNDLRDYMSHPGERQPWRNRVVRQDGTELEVAIAPVSGGGTLVTFRSDAAAADGGVLGPPPAPAPFLRRQRG